MEFKKKKHNIRELVAATMILTQFSGCGAVLNEGLRNIKGSEIVYCDLCGVQSIHNKHQQSELFSLEKANAEFTNNSGDVVWGVVNFKIKKKDVFLDFLKRNYKKLPKKLFIADEIIVRGNVAQAALNGEAIGDSLTARKKFIPLGGEPVIFIKYRTGKKWKETSIPISTCINQFFLGKEVSEARKKLIEENVIDPKNDCRSVLK